MKHVKRRYTTWVKRGFTLMEFLDKLRIIKILERNKIIGRDDTLCYVIKGPKFVIKFLIFITRTT